MFRISGVNYIVYTVCVNELINQNVYLQLQLHKSVQTGHATL